jgi:diacylglycerol O-acyltransferase / wax synthase
MKAVRKRREFFSSVDAAWLHMEKPTNMAMITGIMIFDEPLDFARLKATLEHRLLIYDRFLQRPVEPTFGLGLPRWETDPDFDLNWHLKRIKMPPPGDLIALQDLVGEMMSTPLDFSKPLWQFHLVEDYANGSVLICRLHHCIADGLALVQVMLSLTDDGPDAPWPASPDISSRKLGRLTRMLIPAVRVAKFLDKTRHSSELLLDEMLGTLINPSRLTEIVGLGASSTRALGKLLLLPPDRKTILRGKCSVPKHAAWSKPIKLEEVKAVGKLMGGTINDVLLSCLTGALRRYLEGRDQQVAGLNIRAVVPVSIRPPEDLDKLGNRFGLVFLSLPIGIRDPIKRMSELKRRMDAIKDSPEALVAFGILNTIGMTPVQIEDIIVKIFGMKGTAVMTNVPGPRQVIYLAGRPLRSLMFWVPQPGNLGIGVSILSYAGDVALGVATDAGLVPDPERIILDFHEEFNHLKHWGRPPQVDIPDSVSTTLDVSHSTKNGRCQALTKEGQQCKNRARTGYSTCYAHRKLSTAA